MDTETEDDGNSNLVPDWLVPVVDYRSLTIMIGHVGEVFRVMSTLITTCLAVTRSMCVIRPFHFRHVFTRGRTCVALCVVCCVSLCYTAIFAHIELRAVRKNNNSTQFQLFYKDSFRTTQHIVGFIYGPVMTISSLVVATVSVIVMVHTLNQTMAFRSEAIPPVMINSMPTSANLSGSGRHSGSHGQSYIDGQSRNSEHSSNSEHERLKHSGSSMNGGRSKGNSGQSCNGVRSSNKSMRQQSGVPEETARHLSIVEQLQYPQINCITADRHPHRQHQMVTFNPNGREPDRPEPSTQTGSVVGREPSRAVKQVVVVVVIFIIFKLPTISLFAVRFTDNYKTDDVPTPLGFAALSLRQVCECVNASVNLLVYYKYNTQYRRVVRGMMGLKDG